MIGASFKELRLRNLLKASMQGDRKKCLKLIVEWIKYKWLEYIYNDHMTIYYWGNILNLTLTLGTLDIEYKKQSGGL